MGRLLHHSLLHQRGQTLCPHWRLPEEAMDALYGHGDVQENKGRNILDERSDLKSRIMSIAMVAFAMVAAFTAGAENDAPVRRLSDATARIDMRNLLKMPVGGTLQGGEVLPWN